MQSAQGSLTIINPHTSNPQVFWNGIKVEGVQRVRVLSDDDDNRVRIVMTANTVAAEMRAAGINVKEV
jgi:hypothetical protein